MKIIVLKNKSVLNKTKIVKKQKSVPRGLGDSGTNFLILDLIPNKNLFYNTKCRYYLIGSPNSTRPN